jgi:alpha-beta hydrolase superfamily lysophospholipase
MTSHTPFCNITRRIWGQAAIWLWLPILAWSPGVSALAQGSKERPVEDFTLQSPADGWPLKVTYYRSTEGKEAAVVVLLHMRGQNRLVWTAPKGFAEQLQGKGFAVIAVDLRKHGQSKPGAEDESPKAADKSKKTTSANDLRPADYQLMIRDLDAVKKMIFEEHQKGVLNMRKMAIVAPEMSAAIALSFAAADWLKKPYNDAPTLAACTPRGQDVQAMIFLSPETSLPGVLAHQVIPTLKETPMAAMVIVGKTNRADKEQAKKLFTQLGGDPEKSTATKAAASKTNAKDKDKDKDKEKKVESETTERLQYYELPTSLRGTDLIGKKLLVEEGMIKFLSDHVQNLKGPVYEWRDRQSRLVD